MNEIDRYELGQSIGSLQSEMAAVRKSVNKNTLHLEKLQSTMDQAKGGWKAVMIVSAIASTITSAGWALVGVLGWLR